MKPRRAASRWVAPTSLVAATAGAVVAAVLLRGCPNDPPIHGERAKHEAVSDRASLVVETRGMVVHEVEPPYHLVAECEPGERRPHPLFWAGAGRPRRWQQCIEYADGSRRWPVVNTPLVLVFDEAPVTFTRAPGVFHVGADDRTEWVSAATPWLALDRDGSGCIESERELFAGFDVLARLDANRDGRIDGRDPAFAELVLWSDRDQDKRCTPDELTPLGSPIDLAHTEAAPQGFSYEGETAALPTRTGRVVDVYLAPAR